MGIMLKVAKYYGDDSEMFHKNYGNSAKMLQNCSLMLKCCKNVAGTMLQCGNVGGRERCCRGVVDRR